MPDVKGTRIYWRPTNSGAVVSDQQILKNSGYINVVLQAVQYKASGNFWQRLFKGKDKVAVCTQVIWQSGSDSKTAAAIQDFRKVSVPSTNTLAIGRNVVLKVPATADGIELQVSIAAVQDDNLGRTLQLLNSDEFKQPLQLAPVAVGQALTIATMVKKLFSDTDPADVLSASYPGIISEQSSANPVADNKLVQGYIILIVKQDEDDQVDFDPNQISLTGNGVMVNGRPIGNTYMVYNVTFDKWRGRDTGASWSKKFDQASTKADELLFPSDQQATIINASYELLKAGNSLLDEDVNYTTAEKTNLKKAAFLEVQGKVTSNASPLRTEVTRSFSVTVSPPLFDIDVRGDVAAYASELSNAGQALGFSVRMDDHQPPGVFGKTRGIENTPTARKFTPEDLQSLRPHVVSMRQGHWDTDGIYNSTPSDVQALFFQHAEAALRSLPAATTLKFVVYAHGGLVSEEHGLEQARAHINWLHASSDEGIYPLYFVWKTGLGETLANLLRRAFQGTTRDFITDPIVAALARGLGGEQIWTDMKQDAEKAVLSDGAATFVAQQMKLFIDKHPGRIELHAAGHSAGAVFHSHYIPASMLAGNPAFKTTSLLAPAVRVDTFINQLTDTDAGSNLSLKEAVGNLAVFTMKRDFERQDDCAKIYRQSLLYLIYHALEKAEKTPLLGLEESIRSDSRLVELLGLGSAPRSNATVVWSPTPLTDGPDASRSIHHGDFSSDQATLDAVLCRMLGVTNLPADRKFPATRALNDIWDIWATSAALPPTDDSPPAAEQRPVKPNGSHPRSPKRALCVGINKYLSPNTLQGCVSDSNNWSAMLQGLGFDITKLQDESATHAALNAALETLVTTSVAGDVIVFQYAGHGTVLSDNSGRTTNGREEAMVPVDFSLAKADLLMDFDVKALFERLPEGVNLTCFIDCCHSGTNTRAIFPAGVLPRAIHLTTQENDAALAKIQPQTRTRGLTSEGTTTMRHISFAACQDEEVAFESGGQGEFTRHAMKILANGIGNATCQSLADAITLEFASVTDPSMQQHPKLDCADDAKFRPLLQPLK